MKKILYPVILAVCFQLHLGCIGDPTVQSDYQMVEVTELSLDETGHYMIDLQQLDTIYAVPVDANRDLGIVTCPSGVVMPLEDWISRMIAHEALNADIYSDNFLMANGVLQKPLASLIHDYLDETEKACSPGCIVESNGSTECGTICTPTEQQ